jgi:uncharacterized protein YwqG
MVLLRPASRWLHEPANRHETASERYEQLLDDLAGTSDSMQAQHRLLGWPREIQNEMSLEVQLVTSGVYTGDSSGYEGPRADRLRGGAADWMLLLQVDSDEKGPGWMWGDAGRIYFWIRKRDLMNRRFDDVWTILQCY